MNVMRRQIEMAKRGGVHGWIFYWYWFNGHRLLEKPVDAFLADRSLDMPFALMWANENWTRRWDGAENDVLMSQDYRPEEEEALMATLARHFADPRYIRVQGRPVLMMYRAGLMPEPEETVAGWRRRFRENHGEDPVFVMAQSFDDIDPRDYGFDGAIEFPPHKLAKRATTISGSLDYLDPDFTGSVFAFEDIVRVSLEEPEPDFPLIKCAVPGWDNDPRKQGSNTVIIHGARPATYQAWLTELVERAAARPFMGEPFVCVNAWNEWCEGAYLEPDLHFGGAFLNATARAVTGVAPANSPGLLLALGNAEETEGTRRIIEAMRGITRQTGLRVEVLLLAGGPLEADLARIGGVQVAADQPAALAALSVARAGGLRHALMDGGAAARLGQPAAKAGVTTTIMLQEMPGELRARGLAAGLRVALRHAAAVLVPSPAVPAALAAELPGMAAKFSVLEPGLAHPPGPDTEAAGAREALGLAAGDLLLLGAGPGDLRHGLDLFLQLFRRLKTMEPRLAAAWVGALDPALRAWMGPELAAAARDGFRLVEHMAEPRPLLAAADLLAVTARESPMPLVAQQALAAGAPVVAFLGGGGAAPLAVEFGGAAVPLGDVEAMAKAAAGILARGENAAARQERRQAALTRFRFAPYAEALAAKLLPGLPEITVVVPGIGRGRMLASRLDAVFRQDQPVRDVLLLDDGQDPLVAAGAADAATRWHRALRRVVAPGGRWAVLAEAALEVARSRAGYVWIVDPDLAPGADFLRRAAAALEATPDSAFAAVARDGLAQPGAILWRQTALRAALAAGGRKAREGGLVVGKVGILLPEVALLRLAPPPAAPQHESPPPEAERAQGASSLRRMR